MNKSLRRFVFAALVVGGLSGLGGVTSAQAWAPNPDMTRRELRTYDRFVDHHPWVERNLERNPWLVRNPAYGTHHSAFSNFLASHPGVREEMTETPGYFPGVGMAV